VGRGGAPTGRRPPVRAGFRLAWRGRVGVGRTSPVGRPEIPPTRGASP
jgi:hypothetical protein